MRTDPTSISDEPDQPTAGGPSADDALAGLAQVASDYHRLMRRALAAYVAAAEAGTARATGLGPGLLLELEHRLPAPVARQLEAVAARLSVMPDCAEVFTSGIIEFHELATIVGAARGLSGPALAELDRWAACTATDLAAQGLLHLLDGDVQDRVAQLRAPGWASRQEARAERGPELHGQQDFDGGGLLIASLDSLGYTSAWTSIETVAGPPCFDRTRAAQRADALVAIAEHALAGTRTGPAVTSPLDIATTSATYGPDAPPVTATAEARDRELPPARGEPRIPTRPRPRMTVVVDLAQTTTDRFAMLQRVTGLRATPTLSARLVETLTADAELLVQVTDGRRPLVELRAVDIPAPVRRTVTVRDRGCRAPGCHAPPSQCDLHHIIPRADGGGHDPDNLILLCRRHHTNVDRWQITHDPASTVVTWRRHGRRTTHRTVPHGTRPPPARPDHVPLAEWEAPPIPPPPSAPPAD